MRTQLGTADKILASRSNSKRMMGGALAFLYVVFSENCECYRNSQGLRDNISTYVHTPDMCNMWMVILLNDI